MKIIDPTPALKIRETFKILKAGIGPYILRFYKKEYGIDYESEIKALSRSFNHQSFDDEFMLLTTLDSQGWFDLVLKRKALFIGDLKHIGMAYISELMDWRIKLAHEHPLTMEDAYRATDTSARLLELIGEISYSYDLFQIADEVLELHYANAIMEKEGRAFSEILKQQMSVTNAIISELTEDQYTVLKFLNNIRRVVISGCAGSGKTLIALEKAISLDKAGLKTMILCHNPHLSEYLRSAVSHTSVFVYSFASWIKSILGSEARPDMTWSHYIEPTVSEIEMAFDKLSSINDKYDAIIVDEGQDFRESWWIIIEAALRDPKRSFFYIFRDDNQALLPFRAKYPIEESPISLSRNCRNAGQIFEAVKKFHPQSPETSLFLKNKGIFELYKFLPGQENAAVRRSIKDALKYTLPDKLVVLTTEPDPSDFSILSDLEVQHYPEWDGKWQETVLKYLNIIAKNHKIYRRSAGPPPKPVFPTLSKANYPTNSDIRSVKLFAKPFTQIPLPTATIKWSVKNGNLELPSHSSFRSQYGSFFCSDHWAETIPRPKTFILRPCDSVTDILKSDTIPIYTISSFKGLEADAVIVFVMSPNENLLPNLYVGLSRARLYLNLIASEKTISAIPNLEPN